MIYSDNLSAGFNKMVNLAGKPISIKYYNTTAGSVWDDDVTLSEITGSAVYTSGVVLPLTNKFGSEDSNLVEQGKLSTMDQKLYVNGSLDFTGIGSNIQVKIGLGDGTSSTDVYTIIPLGGIPYEVQGVQIFKRVYIRRLDNGSLLGEY